MIHERVWNLKLSHSDVIEIYQTTTDPIIKKKIENHFLADKMSNWRNWSEAQWNAVRKFYDAHNEYPKDCWWDEEAGDWSYLNDEGEIDHPRNVQYFPLPWS